MLAWGAGNAEVFACQSCGDGLPRAKADDARAWLEVVCAVRCGEDMAAVEDLGCRRGLRGSVRLHRWVGCRAIRGLALQSCAESLLEADP